MSPEKARNFSSSSRTCYTDQLSLACPCPCHCAPPQCAVQASNTVHPSSAATSKQIVVSLSACHTMITSQCPLDWSTFRRRYFITGNMYGVMTTHFHLRRHIPMVLAAGIQPLRMSWVPWFAFFWLQCFRPVDVSLLIVAHGFIRLVRRGGQLHYRSGLYPPKDERFNQARRCYTSYAQRVNAHTYPVCSK